MFFVAEMGVKVIAYGFILNPGASLRWIYIRRPSCCTKELFAVAQRRCISECLLHIRRGQIMPPVHSIVFDSAVYSHATQLHSDCHTNILPTKARTCACPSGTCWTSCAWWAPSFRGSPGWRAAPPSRCCARSAFSARSLWSTSCHACRYVWQISPRHTFDRHFFYQARNRQWDSM